MLLKLLGIQDKRWIKNYVVQHNINPYIDCSVKPRLIEAPSKELKVIQRKIKNGLMNCDFPDYVFSGIRGKSYVDNAKKHMGVNYLYATDISAFFPNISREKVYMFFKNELKTSPDVAEILTNFCTSDLSRDLSNRESIDSFLKSKKIKHLNHLCTGSPTSPILSYLVNKKMFDEMHQLCVNEHVRMTIYVDDVIFSCSNAIHSHFRERIIKIITKNGYNVSSKKVKYYHASDVKKATGVIIKSDGSIDVPNRLRLKVKQCLEGDKSQNISQLQGYVVAAKQIRKDIYPSLTEYIKMKIAEPKN